MAKIVVTLGGEKIKEFVLEQARTQIGRRQNNDLVLEHLSVSGRHCAIDISADGCYIVDLGSTNGTLVNRQPIKKHLLQNGDMVEVGKYHLEYILQSASVSSIPEFTEPPAKIRIRNGTNAGKELVLSKQISNLGSPGVSVISLVRLAQGYQLKFVEGKVNPHVNGNSMIANPLDLKHGDIIDMAGTELEFLSH
jgi:pSer/pThr/pTyr-binding forkhead associated (FHA) protein